MKVLAVNGVFLKTLEYLPRELFSISVDNYIKNGSHFSESKLKIQWEKKVLHEVDMHHGANVERFLRVEVS